MALQRYYEPFYKVIWGEIDDGSGWPTFAPTDGDLVMGLFVPSKSGEIKVASAQGLINTIGQFSCDVDAPVGDNAQLRRVSNGFFYALASDPEHVPQAITQFKLYQAKVTDRPTGFVEKYKE